MAGVLREGSRNGTAALVDAGTAPLPFRLTIAMRLRSSLGTVAIAALLLGCGGGGGGGMPQVQPPGPLPPPPPPPPPAPTADSFRTTEYNRVGALDAAEAYALGYTGAGVIVGIVDFGFDFAATDEVNYHPDSVGPNAQSVALYEAQTGTTVDNDPHGHAVAGIIAAKKNDTLVHGIAFDARILAVDYFSNVNETLISQGGVQYHVSDPWSYITARGSKIVNVSFGYDTGDVIPNPPAVTEAYTTTSPAVAVINGALLVSSAGNNGGPNPALSNLDIIDDLVAANALTNGPGAFVVAGSVNGNNQISSFSGRAGTAKDHYMVAPGEDIGLVYMGAVGIGTGTSFSAPLISGAAALILDRWPSLTGRQVADILFQSATDLGAAGVDTTYGHGLLNVEAALQPMGSSNVVVANGTAPALYATGMVLSPAFGDAPAFRASLAQVTILDGFGRDFTADASRAVYSRPNTHDLFGVMEQRFRWHGASYDLGQDAQFSYTVREDRSDAINAFRALNGAEDIHSHETVFQFSATRDDMSWSAGTGLSLRDAMSQRTADDPFTTASLTGAFYPMIGVGRGAFATARIELGDDTGVSFGIAEDQVRETYAGAGFAPDSWSHSAAMRLDHRHGRSLFEFELGGLVEDGGVLGTLAAGGLKLSEQAATVWTSATSETALNRHWSLKGSLTVAAAGVQHPGSSLIASLGPVYATSVSFGIAGKDLLARGDALAFVVGQPLRVERAPVTLITGGAVDASTSAVIMAETQSSLAPSGREIDLETAYRFALADWDFTTSVAYSLDANHVRGQNAVTGVLWLSRRF